MKRTESQEARGLGRSGAGVGASAGLVAAALSGLLFAACSSGGEPQQPAATAPAEAVVTSSVVVTDMTEAKFRADCDARGGTVELHPHCGGFNTCKGFSFDTGTQVLTEHTCQGLNTCAGYSCVVPDA